jgi:hypothetical protein
VLLLSRRGTRAENRHGECECQDRARGVC